MDAKSPHYFDYNATSPLEPAVWEAMEPFLKTHYGNPSSFHQAGRTAARAIKTARKQTAAMLGASEQEIIFTSGGTESNNAALRSALAFSKGRREIVTSSVEHSSIRKLCAQLSREGYTIKEAGVDARGLFKVEEFRAAVSDQTAVVTLMMVNNETGVIFPVGEAAKIAKAHGAYVHVDAVQAVGKYPVSLRESPVDFLSLSAHKFYGPKGVGALFVKKAVLFQPFIFGGSQERGRRAGTENVPGIVGLGLASELVQKQLQQDIRQLSLMRDEFEKNVCGTIPDVFVNGRDVKRICNTSNLCFRNTDGEALLIALDQKGLCASSGSACMSGSREPSHVLKAMGLSDDEANASIRFSFGRGTIQQEIQILVEALREIVARLRSLQLNRHQPHGSGVAR